MNAVTPLRDASYGLRAHTRPDADTLTPEWLWPELVIQGWERVHNHAVSPDGTCVAYFLDRNGYSDLWVLALRSGAFPQRLTLNRRHVNWWEDEPPVWSPDGQWLVYGAYGDEPDGICVSNLYAISPNGGAPIQLTDLSSDAAEACFSPDGQHIVFGTHKGTASQIAITPFAPTSGAGWVIGLTHDDDESTTPIWSPDGALVLYSASPQHGRKQNDIIALPMLNGAAQGAPVRLTPDDDNVECWSPAFSPNDAGARIALLCNYSGYDELWLMARDGSRRTQLSHLGHDIEEFAWSPDGTRLAAIVNQDANDRLVLIDAATGAAHLIPSPAGNYSGVQWVRGRGLADGNALIVGFDAPAAAPALYLCHTQTGQLTALTDNCAAALKHAPFIPPSQVQYTSSDGWFIPALLYLPNRAAEPENKPAIVYPHGGPNVHYDMAWDPIRQYFVAKGYTIICPNFRGSTGYGRTFKHGNLHNWGKGDLHDCLAAAQFLVEQVGADARRLAIWGQSYGGYLSLLALCKDPHHRFRCGVDLFGDSHLKTSWASGDHSGRQDLEWQMGAPSTQAALYEAASPLNFVSNINAPLLVLHGEQDQRVAISESVQLVEALQRERKTFEFHAYADEGHGFAKAANALDALLRIERFLDWWLI
jgi:dipeptidyl aminopeptidase/acylaminoacyl peptidase